MAFALAARIFSFQLFTLSLLGAGTSEDCCCTNGDCCCPPEEAAAAEDEVEPELLDAAEGGRSHSARPVVGWNQYLRPYHLEVFCTHPVNHSDSPVVGLCRNRAPPPLCEAWRSQPAPKKRPVVIDGRTYIGGGERV